MDKLIEAINAHKAALKDIDAKQAAIETEANEKNNGVMTADQVAQYDQLGKDYDAKAAELAEAEASLKRQQERKARPPISSVNPRKLDPHTASPLPAGDGASADDGVRVIIPAHVRQTGSLKNFKGTVNGRDAKERAYRFGQLMLARASQCLPGRFNFRQAIEFADEQFGGRNAVLTSNDGNGSHYLIPNEFGTDLIDLREQYGVVRRLFKNVPMVSDTRSDPRRTGGATAYFVSEGAAGTESDVTNDNVLLVAKDLMVLMRYTNQLSADAVINIGDDLMGEIAQSFALKEDQCGLIGTGSSTYGGIVGASVAINTGSKAGMVTQGTGNTWGAQVMADFHNVVAKLPQFADTGNAAWVCHRAYYYGVMQKLELASGGVPAAEIREGNRKPRPLFLGYPVEFSQVMPSATDTAHVPVMLGDFTLGASFGDRQQESITFSEHASVGGQSVFERNQIAVRGTERFDIVVHGVGDASNAGPIVALQTS